MAKHHSRRPGSNSQYHQVSAATEFLIGVAAIAGCLPVSAIIVAWLTYLPRLVEAASARVNVASAYAQTYLAAEMKPTVNNTSLKGRPPHQRPRDSR
jgi:hypothetical protein